jgi:hypothetical protein
MKTKHRTFLTGRRYERLESVTRFRCPHCQTLHSCTMMQRERQTLYLSIINVANGCVMHQRMRDMDRNHSSSGIDTPLLMTVLESDTKWLAFDVSGLSQSITPYKGNHCPQPAQLQDIGRQPREMRVPEGWLQLQWDAINQLLCPWHRIAQPHGTRAAVSISE